MSERLFSVDSTADVVYREVGGIVLHLDLHRPVTDADVPVVAWFHGGAWMVGERTDQLASRILPLVRRGIAVAAVQYRLTGQAPFPAQLLDARAAIDWLREHGGEYGLATERIGAWGSSAGGHLAALLGLESPLDAAGEPAAEPVPPLAAAVAAWNAPFDLDAAFARSWLEELEDPIAQSAERALVGAPTFDPSDPRHRAASPRLLVSPAAAPMQFVTGDVDRIVSPTESFRMHDALRLARVESSVLLVGGAGHEGAALDADPNIAMLAAFFRRHLLPPPDAGSQYDNTKESDR
ncbi:MAG: alpha/beta hydrolase [Leucobacter sp.]|nr:alpha/beta hydrolase [Leucobacter sp.]